jgi:hypothetical protein
MKIILSDMMMKVEALILKNAITSAAPKGAPRRIDD